MGSFVRSSGALSLAVATVLSVAPAVVDQVPAAASLRPCAAIGPRPASSTDGEHLGIVPPRSTVSGRRCTAPVGASARAAAGSGNRALYGSSNPLMTIHQGVVMGTAGQPGAVTLAPILWSPPGMPLPAAYASGIVGFDDAVAASSGAPSNVFSLQTQYTDAQRRRLAYAFESAPALVDTAPLPAPGSSGSCAKDSGAVYHDGSGYSACVTDDQIAREIWRVVSDAGLPADRSHLYTMVLPKGAEVCFSTDNSARGGSCTVSFATSSSGFCAYHTSGSGDTTPADLVYAALPFPAWDSPTGVSCNAMDQFPSGSPDLDVALSTYSHEISEAVTDPFGTGWHDSAGNENGDLCAYTFGTLSGPQGRSSNQLISAVSYLLQQEFSNAAFRLDRTTGCQSAWTPPTASITVGGQRRVKRPTTFTLSSTTPSGKRSSILWTVDGVARGTAATRSVSFETAGLHSVSVTVTDAGGYQASASASVTIAP